MSKVLVTGGSGFVGSHVIVQLLQAGHDVRTTVRSLGKEAMVREMIKAGGVAADVVSARLAVVVADLDSDAGWADAVSGCDYVHHVASPMPVAQPKDEMDLIRPARDGAVRVLRFARDAGVKRVVFTSTCGAIYYGHPLPRAPFDETSFTNVEGGEMTAYVKSKALAEQAVWEFMKREGGALELAVVNPTGIFGPVLGKDVSSSIEIIARLLRGMPAAPRIYFGVVDVRDVADLHLRCMTDPRAAGQRFIASADDSVMSMLDVATTLRSRLGPRAAKAPQRQMADAIVRFVALFSPALRTLIPLLGKQRHTVNAKAKSVLGWQPRSREDAVVATAESLLRFGVVG